MKTSKAVVELAQLLDEEGADEEILFDFFTLARVNNNLEEEGYGSLPAGTPAEWSAFLSAHGRALEEAFMALVFERWATFRRGQID